MLRKSILIGLFVLNNNKTIGGPKRPLGRVGKAIVLTCIGYGRLRHFGVGFPTAGYCRLRRQWAKHVCMEINLQKNAVLEEMLINFQDYSNHSLQLTSQ